MTYPPAHLLGLPLELREAIYSHLTEDTETLHIWDRKNALHLSAAHTPPVTLLQAHPVLYDEALAYFHRNHRVTLHVDAYAFACLQEDFNLYSNALKDNHYIQNTRVLDLRPTLNASIEFLTQAMHFTIPILLTPTFALRSVAITWAEAVPVIYRHWRPWAYKGVALEPLWGLVGRVEVRCEGCRNPPPGMEGGADDGLKKIIGRMTKNQELYKSEKGTGFFDD
jgi:hypothetical protein